MKSYLFRSVFLLCFLGMVSVSIGEESGSIFSWNIKESAPVTDYGKWTLSKGAKGSQQGNLFELTAEGGSGGWSSSSIKLKSRSLYHFKTKICGKNADSQGSLPIGFDFQNRDCGGIPYAKTPEKEFGTIAFVPDTESGFYTGYLRLAQWESMGTFLFADPQIEPVVPIYSIHKSKQDKSDKYLPLGEDESVLANKYKFVGFGNEAHGNFSRPLYSTTSSFNTNRWCLGGTDSVVYRFQLQPISLGSDFLAARPKPIWFTGGTISVNIGHYVNGRCVLEASTDGKTWKALGSLDKSGAISGTLKLEDFGQKEGIADLWVRFRAEAVNGKWASFQVSSMKADLTTDSAEYSGNGQTVFADIKTEKNQTSVKTGPFFLSPEGLLVYVIRNLDKSQEQLWKPSIQVSAIGTQEGQIKEQIQTSRLTVTPVSIPANTVILHQHQFRFEGGKKYIVQSDFDKTYTWEFSVPDALVQRFTKQIDGLTGTTKDNLSVSWCEPEFKVIRKIQAPTFLPSEPVKINSAKNDYESFQIVLRPDAKSKKGLIGLKAEASSLEDGQGNKIDSSKVQIRYAYYHFVENPTDKTSISADWPDALVPLKKGSDGLGAPLNVEPGCSQPLWITVRVDDTVKSGTYKGKVLLKDQSGALEVTIPYTLTVWDITLPKKNTISTAFGLVNGNIYNYHNCKTEEQRRAVFEFYLKNFSEHRISPYDPAPMDNYQIKWRPDTNPPSVEINFDRFDKEMRRVFDKYNFTDFRLDVHGMGGGTYEGHSVATIGKYNENTPEYKAMFADYARKLENHLKEIGLLDAAYCYWFDEPEPKDYDFVSDGFARLKKYAPGINRMLTEEPNTKICEALDKKNGQLNIWCPVSSNYPEDMAKKRMKKGEKFWWYVCCGPKAPYCTLFIDHPGTELRIWYWQSFERGITGTLVWSSNWWTSPTAFPDKPQNPYLDPMGYVQSGSLTNGTKNFWGNGDGRFVYPPLSAAEPGRNNGQFILDEPVSSIRWETIREGVEDYELLVMLSDLAKKKESKLTQTQKDQLAQIFDFSSITTSMTKFSKVPKPIYEKRQAVANMIMALKKL